MNQKIMYGVVALLIIGIATYIIQDSTSGASISQTQVVEVAAAEATGAQVLKLSAVSSGFSPEVITAKANQKAVLTFKSQIAGGCQNSLVIPSLNISKAVKPFGEVTIAIPPQKAGTTLEATCSMGMFRTQIKFT